MVRVCVGTVQVLQCNGWGESVLPILRSATMKRSEIRRFHPTLKGDSHLLEARLAPSAVSAAVIPHFRSKVTPPSPTASSSHHARSNLKDRLAKGSVKSTTPVLSATPITTRSSSPTRTPPVTPTTDPTDALVPANAGPQLAKLYTEYRAYVAAGSVGTFTSSLAGMISIQGNTVGVDIRGKSDVATFAGELSALGMKVGATESVTKTVEGFLPIDQIPMAASLPDTVAVSPIFSPILRR